jgi:hypothetical protein
VKKTAVKRARRQALKDFKILVGDQAYQAFAQDLRTLQARVVPRVQAAGLTEDDVAQQVAAFRRGE